LLLCKGDGNVECLVRAVRAVQCNEYVLEHHLTIGSASPLLS
jgi:hypothetical protein